ncbi:hypothetical protein N7492_004360 [Penicillium capsulatum]|uniref:Isopenicillin N synthase-like Fe(2+) 2OG dioxygenase domain-containing protein n=1 Tax=Penicillium capsulatum TaxID=69766 RepID=A0A9W9IDM0_9EURO|nr:hypothetical protein N7492_004360 [Penicillium capsulatum]KAJ6136521.1 hypothetical protein N7512_001681 [Penicillium capsulatum]
MAQTTVASSKTTMTVRGQSLEVAELEVVRLEKLAAKDPVEMKKLLKAAEFDGYFYITFDDELSKKVASYIETSYSNSRDFFARPLEEKMKEFRENETFLGYKRSGIETFEIPRDVQNTIVLPSPFSEHAEATLDLAKICDDAVRILLRSLSESLGLGEPSSLETAHDPDGKSDSGLKFISAPAKASVADVPDNTHTDTGSITLLWSDNWVSAMQTKDTKEWLWIDPKPGYVLVNIADFLHTQTDGRLHSPVHKVSQPFDGVGDRYFVSYFLRQNY